jgi:hypothetical protein
MTAIAWGRAGPSLWWRRLGRRGVAFKQGFDAARRELLVSGRLVAE